MRAPTLALGLALLLAPAAARPAADPTPAIRGRFDLVEARSGRRATQASYAGKLRLVFFGFTRCPLTCPVGLRTLDGILRALGPDAGKVRALFITLDPERDDAKAVAAFLDGHDPRITGLVGRPKAVHAAMRDFRLEAERIGQGDQAILEHPAIIYVMDPAGAYLKTVPSNGDAATIAAELRPLLAR